MNIARATLKYIFFCCIICLPSLGAVTPESTPVDFAGLAESGLYSQTLSAVTPSQGCLKIYNLEFPKFSKGVINRARVSSWVAGYLTAPSYFTSFSQFSNLSYGDISDSRLMYALDNGYYLLLKINDGRYLAVLPLVSSEVMASITVYEGVPRLKLCTFGTDVFTGDAPLFTWAFADDPYSATQQCWDQALASDFCKDNIQRRSDKEYPELYNYLGWCTWEAFGGGINEANVIQSIRDIKTSPVPVRWVIVDDGYLNTQTPTDDRSQILDFGTNNKFPNGWNTITSLKDDASVKWMGIWRNMSGGMGGVHPNCTMTGLSDHLMLKTVYEGDDSGITREYPAMIVKPDVASSTAFYQEMIGNTKAGGFDFVKVDFQTFNFWIYEGTGNAVSSAHQNNQALEAVCKTSGVSLLNCISQCNVNVFNTRHSVLSRASVDIKLDLPEDNMKRTRQSFANNMWWGDILIGDFDMYHTSNVQAAQYLTIARAVSGGPIYISDLPTDFDEEVISPVIFSDGKIIRALAPAVPLSESLFSNGRDSCYRVIAPTRHKSCAIAAFNFSRKEKLTGSVSKEDYPFAAAKEQPYTGLWKMPKEGLVIYDVAAKKGARLDQDYTYHVDRMKGKIFTLAPINDGWAVIGRADKYLGGCTYTLNSCTANQMNLTLDESGPLIVFHNTHIPQSSEGIVTDLGNGFYRIDLPIGESDRTVVLSPGRKRSGTHLFE